MSDTPKTDVVEAYLKIRITFKLSDHEIWRNHAQKLERERGGWRKCAEHLADALKFWVGDDRFQIGGHHESRVALDRFHELKEAKR